MKILPEYFDGSQFIQPNFNSHFTIKRPYVNYAKSINIKFEDYYVSIYYTDQSQTPMCSI
jgi:hypothetical protein